MKWEMMGWWWHQLDHFTGTSLKTDNHTNTSSFNAYQPTAIPDPPTASKH